jgi:hypothetical protein
MRARHLKTAALTLALAVPSTAIAKPPGQKVFCDTYPGSATCSTGQTACTTCHTTPPALNPFGTSVAKNLAPGAARPLSDADYAAALPAALRAAESADADADMVSNGDEIRAGSDPANAQSKPGASGACDAKAAAASGWNVCGYDSAYVYRKVFSDFCGRSATYEERKAFSTNPEPKKVLHETLDTCLASEYWQGRDGVVWNLASPKIRPIQSIKGGKGAGPVPLADYYNDYALFVYAETGDRDARDLLTAQYLVTASDTAPTTYKRFERTVEEDLNARDFTAAETVNKQERAGMISSSWFRVINTMFTAVPRTTAAQAYRSYLGLDIALQQGLTPGTSAEPIDYDSKGVRAPGCISCHQTLDPLSYPFSRYEALDLDDKSFQSPEFFSSYRRDRMARFAVVDGPKVLEVPEEGAIFGKPVKNLVEWAKVASESDAFAQKTILDYWRVLFGTDPGPAQNEAFTALWKRFRDVHGYQIQKTLHDLIDTEVYGVP